MKPLAEKKLDQFISRQRMMLGHIPKYSGEGSRPNGFVQGNRDVMLAVTLRCEPNMTACLSYGFVTQQREFSRKNIAIDITRKSHEAMTCSRT